jgi:hypothetical protein
LFLERIDMEPNYKEALRIVAQNLSLALFRGVPEFWRRRSPT